MPKKSKSKGGDPAALVSSIAQSFESDYIGTFVGNDPMDLVEEWIPSTNVAINYQVGDPRYGAFPISRIVTLFGKKSSGKSLILYDAGANVQKMKGYFVLIDTEASFTKSFGQYLGIDFNRLIYAQIRTIEETTDFIESVIDKIRSKDRHAPILVGWDSLASATTLREDESLSEDGKSDMGYRGKMMSQQLRKLGGMIAQERVCYMVCNQTRHKVGIMFGDKTAKPGGDALPFHSSIELKVTKTKQIKLKKKRVIGHKTQIFVEKNKCRPPFGKFEINVFVDKLRGKYGLDKWSGLTESLLDDGVLVKSGKSLALAADTDVTFAKKKLPAHWPQILESLPEDLYAGVQEDDED